MKIRNKLLFLHKKLTNWVVKQIYIQLGKKIWKCDTKYLFCVYEAHEGDDTKKLKYQMFFFLKIDNFFQGIRLEICQNLFHLI